MRSMKSMLVACVLALVVCMVLTDLAQACGKGGGLFSGRRSGRRAQATQATYTTHSSPAAWGGYGDSCSSGNCATAATFYQTGTVRGYTFSRSGACDCTPQANCGSAACPVNGGAGNCPCNAANLNAPTFRVFRTGNGYIYVPDTMIRRPQTTNPACPECENVPLVMPADKPAAPKSEKPAVPVPVPVK